MRAGRARVCGVSPVHPHVEQMDEVVLLVARFVLSLPKVFAVSGTPRDVERIVASLREVIVARKLERPLRVHLLHSLQLLCKLQTGIISIRQLETAVAATDLAVCEHHLVSYPRYTRHVQTRFCYMQLWSLDDLYMVLGKIWQVCMNPTLCVTKPNPYIAMHPLKTVLTDGRAEIY